jgi:starvation-inducible outer membrane lipoprotein
MGIGAAVALADNAVEDDFEHVLYNVNGSVGRQVVWGASIVELTRMNLGVELVMQQVPLDRMGDDTPVKFTAGRFIAQSDDSTLVSRFKSGDLVVVTGNVNGSETRTLGNGSYTYPVVRMSSILTSDHKGDYETFSQGGK